ncbi:hypothetical protein JI739_02700 [Ramlibacter sp. AW1]|uniref:Lipoprotein n=1 Tax=Ramlibacter aurantiacus TaxID=2801330 RepID=A0A936ZFC6_9BURK|nr:hypothetical protein [Ramlibacter aurantiacus]MBL0419248.1 hypothetical protein [Ramlibacter aurantiacus]
MRKPFISFALAALFLSGCATPTLKDHNRKAIENARQIEIIYNAERQHVQHKAGENARAGAGMLGVFGAVGAIAGAATMYGLEKVAKDQSEERTIAFNRELEPLRAGSDMNRDFAERLAELLRAEGRVVKLTEVRRLPGSIVGAREPEPRAPDPVCGAGTCPHASSASPDAVLPLAGNGYQASPGYTPLLLRVNTGYTASQIHYPYEPAVLVESALIDPASHRYLVHHRWDYGGTKDRKTYQLWEDLAADVGRAREQVRGMLAAVNPNDVKKALLDF